MNGEISAWLFHMVIAAIILTIGLFIIPDIFTLWYANLLMRLIVVSLAGYLFTRGILIGLVEMDKVNSKGG